MEDSKNGQFEEMSNGKKEGSGRNTDAGTKNIKLEGLKNFLHETEGKNE